MKAARPAASPLDLIRFRSAEEFAALDDSKRVTRLQIGDNFRAAVYLSSMAVAVFYGLLKLSRCLV